VRPFQLVHVLCVRAEIQDVLLREPYVLDQLPDAVLDAGRARASLVGRKTANRLVEADVRFFPVEKPSQLFAERIVTHGRHYGSCRDSGFGIRSYRRRKIVAIVSSSRRRPERLPRNGSSIKARLAISSSRNSRHPSPRPLLL